MKNQSGVFSGKVALVTGASSGIGKATARLFANAGAKVVLSDIQSELGEQQAAEIRGMGGSAVFVRCDVSKASDVETLIMKSIDHFGKIDCAFNNAGIEGIPALTADCSEENWDKTIATNLKGVWLCMKYEIREMLKRGGGAIVNTSSVAGLVGFATIPAYTASKHGIIGLTQSAALEYAKNSIRVNVVCPGVIATAMIDRFTHGDEKSAGQLAAGEPVGRMGKPEEVGKAVLWLCSGDASFVTGTTLAVDGGWVAQ